MHYGEEHPSIGMTLNNLEYIYGSLGEYVKQKELLEKALAIKMKYYGEDHPSTGVALMNVGNVYGLLGDYEKSKELLEKVFKIFNKHYGSNRLLA